MGFLRICAALVLALVAGACSGANEVDDVAAAPADTGNLADTAEMADDSDEGDSSPPETGDTGPAPGSGEELISESTCKAMIPAADFEEAVGVPLSPEVEADVSPNDFISAVTCTYDADSTSTVYSLLITVDVRSFGQSTEFFEDGVANGDYEVVEDLGQAAYRLVSTGSLDVLITDEIGLSTFGIGFGLEDEDAIELALTRIAVDNLTALLGR